MSVNITLKRGRVYLQCKTWRYTCATNCGSGSRRTAQISRVPSCQESSLVLGVRLHSSCGALLEESLCVETKMSRTQDETPLNIPRHFFVTIKKCSKILTIEFRDKNLPSQEKCWILFLFGIIIFSSSFIEPFVEGLVHFCLSIIVVSLLI